MSTYKQKYYAQFMIYLCFQNAMQAIRHGEGLKLSTSTISRQLYMKLRA